MSSSIEIFESLGRISLAPLNTPIEKCERLKKAYPELPNLYIKRDDFIGPLVWGNKLRKLEYSMFDALENECDTIMTYGGIHSNHARITAQVASRLGLKCILVLHGDAPAEPSANFLLLKKHGIEIHYVNTREERHPKMDEVADAVEAKGAKVYRVTLGASDEIGSMGFVRALNEVITQEKNIGLQFNHIFHGSSSGGTSAGFTIGKKLFNRSDLSITGISADDSVQDVRGYVMKAARPMQAILQMGDELIPEDIDVDDRFFGDGYGLPTPLSQEMDDAFAIHEGILLDGTYTAKVASAIVGYARDGRFKPDDNVLFWHTGGVINLFKRE